MRLSVTSWFTTEEDADRSVSAIVAAWRAVQTDEARGLGLFLQDGA
jgi:hypothetical protein